MYIGLVSSGATSSISQQQLSPFFTNNLYNMLVGLGWTMTNVVFADGFAIQYYATSIAAPGTSDQVQLRVFYDLQLDSHGNLVLTLDQVTFTPVFIDTVTPNSYVWGAELFDGTIWGGALVLDVSANKHQLFIRPSVNCYVLAYSYVSLFISALYIPPAKYTLITHACVYGRGFQGQIAGPYSGFNAGVFAGAAGVNSVAPTAKGAPWASVGGRNFSNGIDIMGPDPAYNVDLSTPNGGPFMCAPLVLGSIANDTEPSPIGYLWDSWLSVRNEQTFWSYATFCSQIFAPFMGGSGNAWGLTLWLPFGPPSSAP